ncbi:MAG: hypothetical protein RIE06_27740 [Roseibium album]|uniref:hypothetical protein n=1 Tax=Roseibium album TaxID=311410 RepID=UPI0032EBEB06
MSAVALAFAATLSGAAAAELPVSGAFGLEFDRPIAAARLGASLEVPPYPLPPDNLAQSVPEAIAGAPSGWHLFTPLARPELLDDPEVNYFVLVNASGMPLRILAEHPEPDCIEDMLWLTRSLARKYQAKDDPFGAARSGFRQSARFVSGHTQVDVSCGPRLLIEYTDAAGYGAWLAERNRAIEALAADRQALAHEQARVEKERLARFADDLTIGDRFRVLGAFGIVFGEPMDPAWFETADMLVDEPLPARPPLLPAPFERAAFLVTVGPDRVPVRVACEVSDPDASLFARLAGALETKYGPPLKNSPQHRIHKVAGDYLVARYLPESATARLVFIDDKARDAQKDREAAAHARRLAEQRRQFEEETAGL